ncbi:MAG: hypothetical protein QOD92_208 [Acidimicrobiaceae bacterium]|jgi:hypothetical protein
MTRLSGSGLGVDVPAGWEGRIYGKAPAEGRPEFNTATTRGEPPPTNAVLHVASFPLPPGTGDYGGGAVEQMTNKDLLVVLMEHGQESLGTALFEPQGIPRIESDEVSTMCLQRLVDGQAGVQRFFTENGRTFCLYVVFGSFARRVRTVPVVNDILKSVSIS